MPEAGGAQVGGAQVGGAQVCEARVWVVALDLDAAALARCGNALSGAERARAERFLRAEDRDRYRASHAALRLLLGRALGRPPGTLEIAAGPGGKPEIPGRPLHFNLSHSGRHALVGLCAGAAIGVDVEAHRPLPDALRIARHHFAPDEAAALEARPWGEREAAFFGLWTRKEAVVKALGAGLALPLDRFSLTLPPEAPRLRRLDGGDPLAWTLAALALGPNASATAAVDAPGARIESRHLPADWTQAL